MDNVIDNDQNIDTKETFGQIEELFTQILNVNDSDEEKGFMQLGGDSIKALMMVNKIKDMGYNLEINELMELNTVQDITNQLIKNEYNNAWQEEKVGSLDATNMELYSTGMINKITPWNWVMTSIQNYEKSKFMKALQVLFKKHDLLRGTIEENILSIQSNVDYLIDIIELQMKINIVVDLQEFCEQLAIADGKAIYIVHYEWNKVDYIAFVFRRFLMDQKSMSILKEDILHYYNECNEKKEIDRVKKTAPYTEWIDRMSIYSNKSLSINSEDYLNQLNVSEIEKLQRFTSKEEIVSDEKLVSISYNNCLLAAYYKTICESPDITDRMKYIKIMTNGRNEKINSLNFSETIGCFDYYYCIKLSPYDEINQYIIKAKELLAQNLSYGFGYSYDVVDNSLDLEFGYRYTESLDDMNEIKILDKVAGKANHVITVNVEKANKGYLLTIDYNQKLITNCKVLDFYEKLKENLELVKQACTDSKNIYEIALDYGMNNCSYSEFQGLLKKYRDNIERIYRLTTLQKGMLFHKLENKSSTNYHMQYKFNLDFYIDVEYIEDAMNLLVQTHPALKSTIVYKEVFEPVQIVLKHQKPCIKFNTVKILNKQVVEEYLAHDLKEGFNFEEDSLVRVTVLKDEKNPNNNTMIWNFHHIIVDGWSIGLIFRDFFTYYQQLAYGDDVFVHKVPFFENYVNWIYERDMSKALEYWSEELKGYATDAKIRPSRISKKSDSSFRLAQLDRVFEEDTFYAIKRFSGEKTFTQNHLIEIAWGILLQKYTYSKDVVFGKVVSGRNADLSMIEETVGLFINTIPVRVVTEDTTTFIELLQKQKEKDNSSLPYQWCSLYDIQKYSKIETPLIQTLYVCENFYNTTDAQLQKNGIEVKSRLDETNFDITVIVNIKEQLKVTIVYNEEKYSKEEMGCILELLEITVSCMISNPDNIISDQSIITQKDKESILKKFNHELQEEYCVNTIPYLLNKQIAQSSDHTAIQDDKNRITYSELGKAVNNIAGFLYSIGICEDDRVAIVAHKTMDTIIGICGIIYVGAAYVPIDPNDPIERKKQILEDCSPSLIITSKDDNVPGEIRSISIEDIKYEKSEFLFQNKVSTESVAYIIYTSGTTGQPKGVMVEHRNIVRLVKGANYVPLNCNTRILETGSIAFDASTFEIWGSLLNGGTLFLFQTNRLLDSDRLEQDIKLNSINTMWVTSSLFNQLISMKEDIFDNLSYLLIGGEKLSKKHVRMFKSRENRVVLINGYGPTENTTFTTTYEIPKQVERIPIGRPITNTTVYIMQKKALCGIGMLGELCVGGYGVAKGYYNQEEYTNEKFINNPYSKGRLYKTGDIARWLPDGNIEYIGRVDGQLKIRGFRIELDEIEEALKHIEGIDEVAVSVYINERGDKQLNAYYISTEIIEPKELMRLLKDKLPGYMIPRYYLQMDKFPLNRNGKVDKYNLPIIKNPVSNEFIAPRDELELALTAIYRNVLLIDRVGITDNFFDLGGHSIRATVVINAIERELSVRLNIKDIMENPTVALLAQKVRENKEVDSIHIEKAEPAEYYEASEAQRRIYISANLDTQGLVYNMPMTIAIPGDMSRKSIEDAFTYIVQRHEAFRTSFRMIGNRLYQFIQESIEFKVAYNQIKECEIDLEKQKFIQPFNLEQAPLLRVKILECKSGNFLLMDMHHIISDGASVSILMAELMKIYKGEVLPAITIQYKDYSEWFKTIDLTAQKEYWLDQFKDGVPIINLPMDYRRGKKRDFSGNSCEIMIPIKITRNIKQITKEEGVTEYMLFLACLMVLLSKLSGKEDIVIGSPISSRVYSDIENTMGMFVNTLAMRGKPRKDKTFRMFLNEIKNICISSYENQEYPFDRLVDDLNIKKEVSRNPIFDVLMVLQNNETSIDFGNNGFRYCTEKAKIAKFDITVNIEELNKEYFIKFEYATALYSQNTIQGLMKQYTDLLENIQIVMSLKLEDITLKKSNENQDDMLNCIQDLF